MANQVVVTNSGNVQVSIEPPPNVQVQISRAAIGNITVSNVSTANFANYAGNVVNANQPNITSLGTLTGLTSSGNITAPFFLGNVIGNISGNLVVPGSNTSVLYNNQGNAGASDAFQFNQASNTVTILGNLVGGNISGNGAGIANIAGANVTGTVANANYAAYAGNANTANSATIAASANSVSVGNVVGIGNIATVNLDGNASNVLHGNGIFAPVIISNVANANYANFAGNAFSVAGANVTGTVANANYAAYAGNATVANTANSVAGANVVGTVANANYATFAGTAFSVSGSNVSGTVANANYAAYAGNVVNGSQPNITSVGNLTALTVTGNISAGNINGGNLVSANYLSGDGYLISNLTIGAGSSIVNGNSNVVVTANGNVTTSVAGVSNVLTVTSTGANLSGNLTSLNANLGNLATANYFSGDGGLLSNITAGNIVGGVPVRFQVKNTSGGVLTKGTPIYVTGTVGATIVVEVAASRADTPSTMGCVGLLETTLNNNDFGYAVSVGTLSNFNTSTYSVGSQLYVGATGGLTATRPTNNNVVQSVGIVGRVNSSTGSVEVNIWNINSLPNLDNGNIWVGNTGNGYPVQAVLSTANVGNANFAAFSNVANLANSVAGANVTGTVANANYAAFSNVANSANSVAVGNVVGIGNIATINLDGNSSNALLGNGGFGPVEVQSTSIANGTSNINIPTANGQITVSVNNNSNLVTFESNASLINTFPLSSQLNSLRINTIGGSTGDAHRITWARSRGTVAIPTSVQNNDFVMSMVGLAHNGTTYATALPLLIRGFVDSTYTTNTANVPMGLRFTVAQTTESGSSNTGVSHNFWSNGNVTFAQTVTANLFSGNANSLSNIPGSNVTGQVSFAATANSVAVANVSGIGNIATINLDGNASNVLLGNGVFSSIPAPASIANGTSNVNIPAANGNINLSANGNANLVVLETTGQINASPLSTAVNALRINTVGNGNPVGDAHRVGFARSRGTIAIPTSVQANDMVGSLSFFGHNGTSYVTAANSVALFRAIVDSSYVTNAATIPIGFRMTTVTGSAATNHNFFSNGTVSLGNSLSITNDFSATGNVSYSGNLNLGRFKETAFSFGNATGTVTPDLFNGSIQTLTLTGNITLNSLSNVQAGSSATLILKQDATGNRKLTSTMKFASGFKTLSTGANAIDIISVFYDGSTYYSTLTTGYA